MAVVFVTQKVPSFENPVTQRIALYTGLAALMLIYSFLLNLFKYAR
jgi:hypothetical protein